MDAKFTTAFTDELKFTKLAEPKLVRLHLHGRHFETATAQLIHEINNTINRVFKPDWPIYSWDEAPQEMKDSTYRGIRYALENTDATGEDQHNAWMAERTQQGWVYGPVKNEETKEHPCLVPYDQLPIEDRLKDHTFRTIVAEFKKGLEIPPSW